MVMTKMFKFCPNRFYFWIFMCCRTEKKSYINFSVVVNIFVRNKSRIFPQLNNNPQKSQLKLANKKIETSMSLLLLLFNNVNVLLLLISDECSSGFNKVWTISWFQNKQWCDIVSILLNLPPGARLACFIW